MIALFIWVVSFFVIQIAKLLVAASDWQFVNDESNHDYRLLAVCRGDGRTPLHSVNAEYASYYKLLLGGKN